MSALLHSPLQRWWAFLLNYSRSVSSVKLALLMERDDLAHNYIEANGELGAKINRKVFILYLSLV